MFINYYLLNAYFYGSCTFVYSTLAVFPKVNWSWMNNRSSTGITGLSIKFTGHSHTPQRRCSDSYRSFNFVLQWITFYWPMDQTNFYWTLPHVWLTTEMSDIGTCTKLSNNKTAKFSEPNCINVFKMRSKFQRCLYMSTNNSWYLAKL